MRQARARLRARDVLAEWADLRAGWGDETVGPSQTQLYVTLMRAMGMPDETFGIESVQRRDGSTLMMRGVLPELVA